MTVPDVSSVVKSILEAFENGANIFHRLRGKKHKKRTKLSRLSEEEQELQDSFSNRPKEIKCEYSQSVIKHGQRFEKGDNQAYSSLAHTLLVLNTGLINLINNALSSNMIDASRSRQSLLLLSESAAVNTMQALGQLNTRLSLSKQLVLATDKNQQEIKSKKPSSSHDRPMRPPPSPLLARGGWVRSRSGSSVVSATSVRKQSVQQSSHTRSKSSPVIHKNVGSPHVGQEIGLDQSLPPSQRRYHSPNPSPAMSSKEWLVNAGQHMLDSENNRPQSMLLVPADYFDDYSGIQRISPAPPIPPKIPIHIRPNARSRPRPPSAATFMTASTKIGEIPEHKWPDRILLEDEREDLPLPYVIPPPLQSMRPKSRGLKFWKKPN